MLNGVQINMNDSGSIKVWFKLLVQWICQGFTREEQVLAWLSPVLVFYSARRSGLCLAVCPSSRNLKHGTSLRSRLRSASVNFTRWTLFIKVIASKSIVSACFLGTTAWWMRMYVSRDGKRMASYRSAMSIDCSRVLGSRTLTSPWTCVLSPRTRLSYLLSSVISGIMSVIVLKSKV